jgi:hypothetical protein
MVGPERSFDDPSCNARLSTAWLVFTFSDVPLRLLLTKQSRCGGLSLSVSEVGFFLLFPPVLHSLTAIWIQLFRAWTMCEETMLRGASIQILKLCHLRYDRSHVGKQQESKEYEKLLT